MELQSIKTFFSWQSDIEKQDGFIRTALTRSSANLENESENENLKIVNDEATRDRPGSPNIPATILEKIVEADIFIADITIINQDSDLPRKTPNPNVLFELGFAVAHLGWSRIILLNNQKFSNHSDLPFDIDRQRFAPFSAEEFNSSEKGNLIRVLKKAVSSIITADPAREIAKRVLNEDEIKKERDVREINNLLSKIDIDQIIGDVDSLPNKLTDKLSTYLGLSGNYFKKYFELYDKRLLEKFSNFFSVCSEAIPMDLYFDSNSNSIHNMHYVLKNHGFTAEKIKQMNLKAHEAVEIIKEIKEIIRNDYIEIDLNQTNLLARKKYASLLPDIEND